MGNVNIEIDGKKCQVPQGSMVIEAADDLGIPIPRFCYHKKLSIAANCRMCLVQVENAPKPMPACATPVSEGMKVFTQSQKAKDAQKAVMEFLLINHPLDCPVCDQGGQCELQDVALEYGKDISRFYEGKRAVVDHDIGPLIETEMTRCIHCTRCVRFGDEVAGLRELGATGRGEHVEIGTYIAQSVSSELSGNVIDLCPVGALTSKPFRFKARAWELLSRASIASHDGLGSNVYYHTYLNKVIRTVPKTNESLNEMWLSDRDRFAYEGFSAPGRLLHPELKRNGRFERVTWEEALEAVVEKLQTVIHAHGSHAIGAIASPNSTTESMYLLQKIMRQMGSSHIDSRLRRSSPTDDDAPQYLDSLEALENKALIFLIGCQPRTEIPLLNHRIRKATQNGAKVVGLQTYCDEKRYDVEIEILAERGELLSDLIAIAKHLDITISKELSACSARDSKEHLALARLFASAESIQIILGEDTLLHPHLPLIRELVAMIAQKHAAALFECEVGANAMGARLAGCVPYYSPNESIKTAGLSAYEMLKEPLKAMILLDCEPEFDAANPHMSRSTLNQVQDVICMTPYASEAMREYADVLLPLAPAVETEGTFVNLTGQWQSFQPVVPLQGEAKGSWKILRVLANLLRLEGFEFNQVSEVTSELQALAPTKALNRDSKKYEALPQGSLVRLGPMAMYRLNNILRRAQSLQSTQENKRIQNVYIHPDTSETLKLKACDSVELIQCAVSSDIEYRVIITDTVPKHCALVYSGSEGAFQLGAPYDVIEIRKVS